MYCIIRKGLYICHRKQKEMQTVDLKQIISLYGLRPVAVARALWPDNKDPYKALHYVTSGKGFLNSQQLSKLSEITGVPVGALFSGSWLSKSVNAKTVQISVLGTMAELNLETRVTLVYFRGSQTPLELTHEKGTTLSQYLEKLTNFINTIN